MTTKTTRNVATPGEDPQNITALETTGTEVVETGASDGATAYAAASVVKAEELAEQAQAAAPTVSAADFAKLMGMFENQAQQIEALKAAGTRAAASVVKAEPLPDYHKTLASKPTTPVLTAEGWIVPANWAVAVGKGS
ncbi:hypothetical protein [Herbaspirillum autotrophicum]|uniref:hypothetical protein n=1 Tax=Herbaspirillum autotrophicum TaxID=180195 RepID=UPI00067A86F7|nr:hypothetical protein [Herbaspirillum autotrophicum]